MRSHEAAKVSSDQPDWMLFGFDMVLEASLMGGPFLPLIAAVAIVHLWRRPR